VCPPAAGIYNLPGLANAADIHIYLIVLHQVLVPASGFSTADTCMHVLFIIFFFKTFNTSQSQTKEPTFGPEFKIPILFRVAEMYKDPQLQNYIPCVPPNS
jgi:hypothetical protein